MSIDWTKPVRFINNNNIKLTVLTTKRSTPQFPVVLMDELGVLYKSSLDGTSVRSIGKDTELSNWLENIPEEVEVDFWINIYEDGYFGGGYRSKADADRWGKRTRIACINVKRTVKKGEGEVIYYLVP